MTTSTKEAVRVLKTHLMADSFPPLDVVELFGIDTPDHFQALRELVLEGRVNDTEIEMVAGHPAVWNDYTRRAGLASPTFA